jgi:hypothetical protein
MKLEDQTQWSVIVEKEQKSVMVESSLSVFRVVRKHLIICAWCNGVCDENGNWQPGDTVHCNHKAFEYSHTICPGCISHWGQRLLRPDCQIRPPVVDLAIHHEQRKLAPELKGTHLSRVPGRLLRNQYRMSALG